jgi:hypothetical protein
VIRGLVLGIALVAASCGGEAPLPPIDPSCAAPDTACPAEPPFAGAPCEGELVCPYSLPPREGSFTCTESRWQGELGCPGCAPPLSESCGEPFAGSAPATVEIGPPSGELRAFDAGERVPIEFGGQGLAMISYRVRVLGDAPPACVTVRAQSMLDEEGPVPTMRPVKLRCGESLPIYEILPGDPCVTRDYAVHLDIEVVGVGRGAADLVVAGGRCPRAL